MSEVVAADDESGRAVDPPTARWQAKRHAQRAREVLERAWLARREDGDSRARCSVADSTHQDAAIQIEAILGNGPRNTHAQARQREGRTREVAAPSLACEITVGGDTDAGVQVEALVHGGYVGISLGF